MSKNLLIESLRNDNKTGNLFISNAEYITYKTGFPTLDYTMGTRINVFDNKGKLKETYTSLGVVGGSYITIIGKSHVGKAQPIDTIIPTPNGNKKLGELKKGDEVFNRHGKAVKILEVFDRGMLDTYKVTLDDGRSTLCCNEHLWTYYTSKGNFKTIELQDMINTGLRNNSGVYRYEIPENGMVQYEEKKYDIDPYVIGAFIGNGCLSEKHLTFSSNDSYTIKKIAMLIKSDGAVRSHESNYSYKFLLNKNDYDDYIRQNKRSDCKYHTTQEFFKSCPEMINKNSTNKRIPNEYLYGSIEQRLALIQGLFDTDGSIDLIGGVRYTSVSLRLLEDIKYLLQTLGIKSRIHKESRIKVNQCYYLNVIIDNAYKELLFSTPRKKERALKFKNRPSRFNNDRVIIKSIENLGYKSEMRCIYIDDPEHLYLTNDYIVTHNTSLAIQIAANIVRDFPNGMVIHYDVERSSNITRCNTLSRFSIEEMKNKYVLRQMDCSLETLKQSIAKIYLEKIHNQDKYRYDSKKLNEFGEKILPYEPTVIILDSIASVTTYVNPETKDGQIQIGEITTQTDSMRLNGEISRFLKESLEMCKEANITLIMINHIKDKPSVGFPQQADLRFLKQNESLPCGKALQYYSSLMFRLTSVGSEKYNKADDGFDGYGILLQFIKSRSSIDGISVPLVFNGANGYDSLRSSFNYAKGLGVIGGNKNGFYFTDDKEKKFRFDTIHDDFKNDKTLYKTLYSHIVPALESQLVTVKPEEMEVVSEEMDY